MTDNAQPVAPATTDEETRLPKKVEDAQTRCNIAPWVILSGLAVALVLACHSFAVSNAADRAHGSLPLVAVIVAAVLLAIPAAGAAFRILPREARLPAVKIAAAGAVAVGVAYTLDFPEGYAYMTAIGVLFFLVPGAIASVLLAVSAPQVEAYEREQAARAVHDRLDAIEQAIQRINLTLKGKEPPHLRWWAWLARFFTSS